MAALIRALAVSGSRKSDGTVNDSGKVFLYEPGTTTIVAGYQDDELSEAWPTSAGGIALDAAGKVEIWVNDVVDVVIEDSEGTTVDTWLGFNKTRAEQVEIENENFTGALTDATTGAVTQALGGRIDLDTVLTRAGTSLGPNFQYQESSGATPRDYSDVIRDIWVNVVDFGADPSGNVDSTTAIQSAMNRVKALGGGVIYFPPGTYKISSALALTDADGITIMGTGASTISQTGGTANGLRFVDCDGLRIQGVEVVASPSSTGTAFSLDGCTDVTLISASCGNLSVGGTFLQGLYALDCTRLYSFGCTYASTGASNKGVVLEGTTRFAFFGGEVGSSLGTTLELTAATDNGSFYGVLLTVISFPAGYTGTGAIAFIGCSGTFSVAAATIPAYRVIANPSVHSSATSSATGAAQTPSLIGGSEVTLTAASGGAGVVTVNAPAVLPGTDDGVDVELFWDFIFKNAASGAVTWTLNAVYVVAAAIPTTDGHTIAVRFRWDRTTSKLREVSRADTVT